MQSSDDTIARFLAFKGLAGRPRWLDAEGRELPGPEGAVEALIAKRGAGLISVRVDVTRLAELGLG